MVLKGSPARKPPTVRKNKQKASNACASQFYLPVLGFARTKIPRAWFELKAQGRNLAGTAGSIPEASGSILSASSVASHDQSLGTQGLDHAPSRTRTGFVCFSGKRALLTVGHEGHYGVGGAAQVGGGTFVGYNPKQGDRPVRGEPKHSSQSQDPQLSKRVKIRKLRSETGSAHLTAVNQQLLTNLRSYARYEGGLTFSG